MDERMRPLARQVLEKLGLREKRELLSFLGKGGGTQEGGGRKPLLRVNVIEKGKREGEDSFIYRQKLI